MKMHPKVSREFYRNPDVVAVAQQLLGKFLCTQLEDGYAVGMITETEAYCGATDKACHAYPNKRTKRTEVMFGDGGFAYVYLCYGIHQLFNIVTNRAGQADAILIRGIEPVAGIELIEQRRKMKVTRAQVSSGPGTVTKALGINKQHYGLDLLGDEIWLEDRGVHFPQEELLIGPRVGIDYAEEDALLPWRFRVKGNKYIGK
ncbi:MAG: DNA-3-methyladenine glycosylase [Flammeovirgaceae bacterium]